MEDWRPGASNMPIMSPSPYLLSRFTSNVPLPTLYAGDSARKPKLSVIELLLYNMASLLAGVAAGYDVRMSNVSPVHPTLLSEVPALKAAPKATKLVELKEEEAAIVEQPQQQQLRDQEESLEQRQRLEDEQKDQRDSTPRKVVPQNRFPGMETTISKSQPTSLARRIGGSQPYYTPVQRTPQHQMHHHQKQQQLPLHHQPPAQSTPAVAQNPGGLVNLYGGTNPPTPSPRRKLSNSSFGNPNPSPSTTANPNPQADVFEEFRVGGGIGPPPLYAPADYLRNGPSYSNDGGNYRNGYFGKGLTHQSSPEILIVILSGSNYFPYRPELNYSYERDCKSYPDYSYDYNHRLPDYYDYQYEPPMVQVPVPVVPVVPVVSQTRTPPPRVPQMGVSAAGHRRTPSTVSNNSNVLMEHEELLCYDYNNLNLNTDYERDREREREAVAPPTKQELYAGSPKLLNRLIHSPLPMTKSKYAVTRPASLPFEQHVLPMGFQTNQPPLAPPLATTSASVNASAAAKLRSSLKKYNGGGGGNGSVSSQQGTPTNPTPPDSLTSDDSSYLSAKEGSIGSQHSRVRFSPEAYLDANPLPSLSRRMTAPAVHQSQQQQQQRRQRQVSSGSTPSPSASSS
ncbi:hypothetical protein KR026_010675 [Drosophila bipectinata]|nr:hypothetical protein KR026_010675 [Drosophila bipectinata]